MGIAGRTVWVTTWNYTGMNSYGSVSPQGDLLVNRHRLDDGYSRVRQGMQTGTNLDLVLT